MAIQPWKLENEELLSKARNTIDNIEITKYQKDVLTNIVNRFMYYIGDNESTKRWAQEAFDENRRLIELIAERWNSEE